MIEYANSEINEVLDVFDGKLYYHSNCWLSYYTLNMAKNETIKAMTEAFKLADIYELCEKQLEEMKTTNDYKRFSDLKQYCLKVLQDWIDSKYEDVYDYYDQAYMLVGYSEELYPNSSIDLSTYQIIENEENII